MECADAHIDRELILLVSAGDVGAFRRVFDKYRNKIYSIAWKIAGEKTIAEDVVQEVFIKLWLHKENLATVENFNAYLNTIVRNHIFNSLRKVANEQTFLQKLRPPQLQYNKEVFDSVCYHELENLVHQAICQLTPQQKKVYNLSRLDGLKHEEIAEKMGISRSTVKGHLVGALSHIKSFLLANGESLVIIIAVQCYPLIF
jgi:RNA polymerase sigma-70 factor (ECF subfamily)